jgi:APA family basic amino acid/polyamine antiporter
MSTVGLFYIKSANFTPRNVSGENAISAIGSGMAIALFIWYSRNTGHSFFVYWAHSS